MNRKVWLALSLVFSGWAFSSISYAEAAKSDAHYNAFCDTKNINKIGFNESHYVEIGGIKQWVSIRGSSCKNPVVLFVHGGPGNPMSLYHRSLFQSWEKEFTIVHWDQRGSGKTYEANQEMGELTIEKLNKTELNIEILVSDGLEVTDYVGKILDKNKVIITGISWGSFLAVKMISAAPEKYSFYVGLSQLVNYRINTKKSYDIVKLKAIEKQDLTTIDLLDSIGSPPWTDPKSFGRLRKAVRLYENEIVSKFPDYIIDEDYNSEKTRFAYVAGEEFSFLKFVGLKGQGMANEIALDKCCSVIGMPIYLIQGENDLLTHHEVTEEYFESIKAPSKKYILLEQSGHSLNEKILETQFHILKSGINRLKNERQ